MARCKDAKGISMSDMFATKSKKYGVPLQKA